MGEYEGCTAAERSPKAGALPDSKQTELRLGRHHGVLAQGGGAGAQRRRGCEQRATNSGVRGSGIVRRVGNAVLAATSESSLSALTSLGPPGTFPIATPLSL